MLRYILPSLVVLLIAGGAYSIQGQQALEPGKGSSIDGKTVLIESDGEYFGPKEHVRFETVGNHTFIVIPMHYPQTDEKFLQWLPMEKVRQLKVFDSKEDAHSFAKRSSPKFYNQIFPDSATK
ncbi:MAG: hypothetical protein IT423_20600 [Pirellulaceae bacterium]|nr:hypothetical protein [Pirellulaceae bacterium]